MLQLESQPEEKTNNHKIIQTKVELNNSVSYSYKPRLEYYFGEACKY